MTKAQALYNFFNSFEIKAYVNTSVPDNASYPFMTYDLYDGNFGDGELPMNVRIYYKTYSEAEPNKKVQEIAERIGRGGTIISCDSGAIWIKKGVPFAQSVVNEDDETIKMRYLNLDIEYLTI